MARQHMIQLKLSHEARDGLIKYGGQELATFFIKRSREPGPIYTKSDEFDC